MENIRVDLEGCSFLDAMWAVLGPMRLFGWLPVTRTAGGHLHFTGSWRVYSALVLLIQLGPGYFIVRAFVVSIIIYVYKIVTIQADSENIL